MQDQELQIENTRIVLVDDHRIVREGLAAVLSRQSDISVIGEAGSAEEAFDLVSLLNPDLVVLDLHMPGMGGLRAIRQLKEVHPTISILVLTVEDSETVLVEAVRAGAAGYVLKDASAEGVAQAIRVIVQGGTVLDSQLLLKALKGGVAQTPGPKEESVDPLTPRELEVLRLLAAGLGNQEIADQLGTSRVTAKKHVHHIIGKLQVSDRTQAVLKAFRLGLADLVSDPLKSRNGG